MIFGQNFLDFLTYCPTEIGQYIFSFAKDSGCSSYFDSSKYKYFEVKDSKLYYLAKNRTLKIFESGEIDFSNFQTGKPGKIIRSFLSPTGLENFDDDDIEQFNNCFKSNFSAQDLTFKRHRDFADTYQRNVRKSGTVLERSCMQDKSTALFDFYKEIPECSILECNEDGDLVGRALIWEIDGETYMDRIYAESPLILEEYYKYAITNKFYRKWAQNYSDTQYWISPEGTPIHKVLKIQVEFTCRFYPYLDTFKYYENDSKTLNNGVGFVSKEFIRTSGGYENRCSQFKPIVETTYCKLTNTWEDPSEVVKVTLGAYAGTLVNKKHTLITLSGVYYVKDPVVGFFYNPSAYSAKYYLIDPTKKLAHFNGYVMYLDELLHELQKESATIYGSKPLHEKLNLIINQKWTTTNA
jgi:hypothetical protein